MSGRTQVRWYVGLGTGTDPAQVPTEQEVVKKFNESQDKIELLLEIVPYNSSHATPCPHRSLPATAPTSSGRLAVRAPMRSTVSGWTSLP